MKKLLPICGAALLAVALSFAAVSPSAADPGGDAIGAGLAGGVLGFMAGAAVAGSPSYYGPHHRYDGYDGYDRGGYQPWRGRDDNWRNRDDFRWRDHVRACFRAYGSNYDPHSDTFTGYDGYSHRCRY